MPVLDTNFLIALHAGDPDAERLLQEIASEVLLVPSIVAVEFLTPFGKKRAIAYERLHTAFTITDTNPDWILAAAALRLRLRREGKKIRMADFWIAAWAELATTYVVTRNTKDFTALGIDTRAW